MSTFHRVLANRRVAVASGITSIAGLLAYHVYMIQAQLSRLVDTNVMEHNKRPEYIYINYSIYRETQNKQMQKKDQTFLKVLSNPWNKSWKSIKHSLAWRLLEMAQKGEKEDRLKAIYQLTKLKHLKGADYQHLAQICDEHTAIALARSNADMRWFLPPKMQGVIMNPQELLKRIHNLLDGLKTHQCAHKLLNKTFGKYQFEDVAPEEFYQKRSQAIRAISKEEWELLKQCVDVLLHLTEDRNVADQIIAVGGLELAMDLYKIFRDSMEIKVKLCQIVTNMSLCKDRQYDFYVTGWVNVLAAWGRDVDIRLNVTSNKALSNLDRDTNDNRRVYKSKIYPLYPRQRTKAEPQLDIVFVHGILGGVFMTWRQREERFEALKANSMTKQLTKNGTNTVGTVDGDWKDGSPHPESVIPMMQRSPRRQREIKALENAQGLAHDIMEAVNSARSSLNSEWEVVYADCPVEATEGAVGPFSVTGEQWVPADEEIIEEEYTNCWPMDFLHEKFPDIRVLGLNYTSTLSEWYSKYHGCGCKITQGNIESRAQDFLDQLSAAGVGENGRPVVFVGHSMGGLIVKSIVTQAMESDKPEEKAVANNTKAILFLGTPHRGTPVAKLKQLSSMLLSPTVEVREMEENSSALLKLHEKFLKTVKALGKSLEIVSIAEGIPMTFTPFKLTYEVVTEKSARIEVGDYYKLNDNHLGICKPNGKQSFLYRRLVSSIQRALEQEAV